MEKIEEVFYKLNYITGWAKEIQLKSRKVEEVLRSIRDDYSNINCTDLDCSICTISDSAEELISYINDVKDDIINENE